MTGSGRAACAHRDGAATPTPTPTKTPTKTFAADDTGHVRDDTRH
ncbi:hypothetical protein [Planotetraspora kaengkrachanensis]|nr:hypothetical protein [Planotetraspora kaengkrachanensis]